ncbi:DUF58 domain-containing protein [Aureliella helgolandensis]|uniref:DUF58 domain-containing protein n=1 Tax=Aureliella helgolandensis TaxID=2527968 RepID=UPI0011A7C3AB|nr:DUF58 domain-containing protein [Aureliella helgolandensis]
MNASQKYFDPKVLAAVRPLGLRARTLIEGLVAGMHRSPLRGHSIEFAQHREYVPGDDLRQVDWKVYARSDKHYLKQYEDETNLTCYLMLDQSESMLYRGQQSSLSKVETAQLIACVLAYLVVSQQDSAGLITFSDGIDNWLPPSSSPVQFDDIVRVLESGKHNRRTEISETIQQTVQRATKPGLMILLSDLLDDREALLSALRLARYARHDVLVIQILDADELQFPFDQLSRFEGMEDASQVVTDPLLIGGAYRKAIAAYCQALESGCRQLDIDYFRVQTDESLAVCLPNILSSRQLRRS